MSLDIPREFHKTVKPFLKQDLNMDLSIKGSYLVITLTPQKRFGTPNTPRKNKPSLRLQKFVFNKAFPGKQFARRSFSQDKPTTTCAIGF
jgi:hypothetical protein